MQPPNEAPVTIFAIIVLWFLDSSTSLGMIITRCHYVRGMPDRVGYDDGKVGHPSGSFLSFHLFVEVSDEVQDLGKEVGQGIFGQLEALRVGKPCQLVQVVAQSRQIAEDGVVFLDEILHDHGIDGCLPDIFG